MQREALGSLISLEMGKIKTEGSGEVQEFIDIVSVLVKLVPFTSVVRLWSRSFQDDEWSSCCFGASRTFHFRMSVPRTFDV